MHQKLANIYNRYEEKREEKREMERILNFHMFILRLKYLSFALRGKKIKKRTSGGVVKERREEERRGLNMTSVFIPSPLQDLTSIFT